MKCPLKIVEDQEKKSKEFGFYWERPAEIITQIRSECDEVEEALDAAQREHLKEELGDLLLAAASLAVFCGYDPYEVLEQANKKYESRFNKVQELAKQDGLTHLKGQSFDVLKSYWNKAKL